MSNSKATATKRARCSNFSAFEENTLVTLAVKHSSVLECKKSDHDVWEAKSTAWRQIQTEFIATTGSNKEIQNLKDKYENLKRKTKKLEGEKKKEIFLTGGGVARHTAEPSTQSHNMILNILGTAAVGLTNPFDGDKPGQPLINKEELEEEVVGINDLDDELMYSNQEYVEVEPEVNSAILVDMHDSATDVGIEDIHTKSKWAKWNPELLKSKKSAELATPLSIKKSTRTTLGESVKKYSEEKVDLIDVQKCYFQNENKRAQEKHDADEKRAQEKHEWERVCYELKVEKLKHEINNLKKVIISNVLNRVVKNTLKEYLGK